MFYCCAIPSIPFPHLNMETYKGKKKIKKKALIMMYTKTIPCMFLLLLMIFLLCVVPMYIQELPSQRNILS